MREAFEFAALVLAAVCCVTGVLILLLSLDGSFDDPTIRGAIGFSLGLIVLGGVFLVIGGYRPVERKLQAENTQTKSSSISSSTTGGMVYIKSDE